MRSRWQFVVNVGVVVADRIDPFQIFHFDGTARIIYSIKCHLFNAFLFFFQIQLIRESMNHDACHRRCHHCHRRRQHCHFSFDVRHWIWILFFIVFHPFGQTRANEQASDRARDDERKSGKSFENNTQNSKSEHQHNLICIHVYLSLLSHLCFLYNLLHALHTVFSVSILCVVAPKLFHTYNASQSYDYLQMLS